jgi:hypothetical protein
MKLTLHYVLFILYAFGTATCLNCASLDDSAASSLTDDTELISVIINGNEYKLNRAVLLRMPYFKALLTPQAIGNTYYNIREATLASYQENMASLPRREQLARIANLALKPVPELEIGPEPEQLQAFFELYHWLDVMQSYPEQINTIAERVQDSIISGNNLRISADTFLSPASVKRAFDYWEIELLKEDLQPDSSGVIAKAFFAPARNMLDILLALIKAEQEEIRIACYLFSSPVIAQALHQATKRGVKVEVIVDGLQSADFRYLRICRWHAPSTLSSSSTSPTHHPKMHNKFFLFSRNIHNQSIIVTGSANCTISAQTNNSENIIVSNNRSLFDQFAERYNYLLASSTCRDHLQEGPPATPPGPPIVYDPLGQRLLEIITAPPDLQRPSAKRSPTSSTEAYTSSAKRQQR